MSGKSRYGKRKHSAPSRKRKERQHYLATVTRQPITAQASMLTPSTGKVDPKASMPVSSATPATDDYASVIAELKRIGILTGIILFIMIVLALLLR
jgi:hypothetical protein